MTTPSNPVSPQPHQGPDPIDHLSEHTTPDALASTSGVIAGEVFYDPASYIAGYQGGFDEGRAAAAADIAALVQHVRAIREQLGDDSMRRIGWGGYLEALTAAHHAAHGDVDQVDHTADLRRVARAAGRAQAIAAVDALIATSNATYWAKPEDQQSAGEVDEVQGMYAAVIAIHDLDAQEQRRDAAAPDEVAP